MKYPIRQVSEKTGISLYVLRCYEKEGLLPHIGRSEGGIRFYTAQDLEQLGLISCLKKTGMRLREIRTFVELKEKGPCTLRERCGILRRQQALVEQKMEEMRPSHDKVSRKLDHSLRLAEEYEKTGRA